MLTKITRRVRQMATSYPIQRAAEIPSTFACGAGDVGVAAILSSKAPPGQVVAHGITAVQITAGHCIFLAMQDSSEAGDPKWWDLNEHLFLAFHWPHLSQSLPVQLRVRGPDAPHTLAQLEKLLSRKVRPASTAIDAELTQQSRRVDRIQCSTPPGLFSTASSPTQKPRPRTSSTPSTSRLNAPTPALRPSKPASPSPTGHFPTMPTLNPSQCTRSRPRSSSSNAFSRSIASPTSTSE
ncbi:hypothetical protein BJY59DRAFT_692075 [Rhodotorula toruloides]